MLHLSTYLPRFSVQALESHLICSLRISRFLLCFFWTQTFTFNYLLASSLPQNTCCSFLRRGSMLFFSLKEFNLLDWRALKLHSTFAEHHLPSFYQFSRIFSLLDIAAIYLVILSPPRLTDSAWNANSEGVAFWEMVFLCNPNSLQTGYSPASSIQRLGLKAYAPTPYLQFALLLVSSTSKQHFLLYYIIIVVPDSATKLCVR